MIDEEKITEVFMNYEEGLEKAINHLKSEYSSMRAGRANPKGLDKIMFNYYGSPTPLNQIANISVQDARMLVISLWDLSAMKETLKAISASDIGINPNDDGKIIRLVFPPLTEERRVEMVKTAKKLGEEAKVTCRNERRDIMDIIKKFKKDNEITEDEQASYEKDIQKTLDSYIAKIDNEMSLKEKDLMSV